MVSTKLCPQVPHLCMFPTFPGIVIPPFPWAKPDCLFGEEIPPDTQCTPSLAQLKLCPLTVQHSLPAESDSQLASPSCQGVVESKEVPSLSLLLHDVMCVCSLPSPRQAEAVPQPLLPGDRLARLIQPQRPHGRRQEEEDRRGGV